MKKFRGFPEGKTHLTPIPAMFFRELLPDIDHLGELKICLYLFWRLDRMEGTFRYLRRDDFAADERLMQGLADDPEQAQAVLDEALERAVAHSVLIRASLTTDQKQESYYFLNSPRGRAAVQALERGEWRPGSGDPSGVAELAAERPNIFRLYEENFGPLTPMIAEALGEAEDSYPAHWIEEAMQIAVEKNARNWRYVAAILERWQSEGRNERKDRQDSEKDRRRYVEGQYSDFIEH
jgi:DNA replication protein